MFGKPTRGSGNSNSGNRKQDSKDSGKKQTLDYRYQLTRDLLTNLHRGECCAVVGVGSCGKSRLLLHLARPETLDYHLGDTAHDQVIITIQSNGLMGKTPWHVYEGIARSLDEALNTSDHPVIERARRDLEPMYKTIVEEKELAFKHLMAGLTFLLENSRLKLTLCFDEFDFVFEQFDAQLFRNLRALRNRSKYQLTYLVAVRKQLPYQRDPATWPDVEEFYELFADNTFAIGPYDERDAKEMIDDLEKRYEYKLKTDTRDLLIYASGGHSGLIGASFRYLEAAKAMPLTARDIDAMLVNDQTNWKECVKIWESLVTDERNAISRMARGARQTREDQNALASLKSKGLIRDTERGNAVIFSPIFFAFAKQQEEDR